MRAPALYPCPVCSLRLQRSKGGPHGLAWHECTAISAATRVQVHQQVIAGLTASALGPAEARSILLKLLVMRAWEHGVSVRDLADALERVQEVLAAGAGAGAGKGPTIAGALAQVFADAPG